MNAMDRLVVRDALSDALARFVVSAPTPDAQAIESVRAVLLDSFAVSIGALNHPTSGIARRYALLMQQPGGVRIWGTDIRSTADVACVVNSAPLRAYDFNDLHIGRRNGGHPSDIVPAVLAVAEWKSLAGTDVIRSLCLGYEVCFRLFESISIGKAGWDYVNLTGIAAVCALSSLLSLDAEQTAQALAIAVVPHMSTIEIESGDLNSSGDLTMWKRFNSGDAMRNAINACLMASIGIEGAVQPFTGKNGFLARSGANADALADMLASLETIERFTAIGRSTFKLWPVGSRAQSAIQAILEARAEIADIAQIERISLFTQTGVYSHLVADRQNPWAPWSRETADHSLPYIAAAAVLDGTINTDSFAPDRVASPEIAALLAKVQVSIDTALDAAEPGEWLVRAELTLADGRVVVGNAQPPPGHPKRPFMPENYMAKLQQCASGLMTQAEIERLSEHVRMVELLPDIGALLDCLPASVKV